MILQGDRNTRVRRPVSERIVIRGIRAGGNRARAHFRHSANARETIGNDVIGLCEKRPSRRINSYVRTQLAQPTALRASSPIEKQRPRAQRIWTPKNAGVLDAQTPRADGRRANQGRKRRFGLEGPNKRRTSRRNVCARRVIKRGAAGIGAASAEASSGTIPGT